MTTEILSTVRTIIMDNVPSAIEIFLASVGVDYTDPENFIYTENGIEFDPMRTPEQVYEIYLRYYTEAYEYT